MAALHHYRFRSEWRLDAPPDDVYLALEALDRYPAWWPEVRRVERRDERTAQVTCRATLPYELVFVTRQERRDREAGVLEARMTGDLEGFSRWTIGPAGDGTTAVFDEEVEATKRLLRVLAPVARPVFRANHELMMRHGRRGLATYLAGVALARERG